MARNSGDADGASPLAGSGAIDLDALLSGDPAADDVMLSATDETIALLNSAFAGEWQGVDTFSAWNFVAFA